MKPEIVFVDSYHSWNDTKRHFVIKLSCIFFQKKGRKKLNVQHWYSIYAIAVDVSILAFFLFRNCFMTSVVVRLKFCLKENCRGWNTCKKESYRILQLLLKASITCVVMNNVFDCARKLKDQLFEKLLPKKGKTPPD